MSGLLLGIDQRTSVRELLQKTGTDEQVEQALLAELNQLWAERLVEMHP
jgi:tagatose-1,6-bisphosphate aldolase